MGDGKKFWLKKLHQEKKINLDIFWLKDENYIDLNNLPEPDEIIDKIYQDLESVLRSVQTIKDSLN